MHCELVVPGLFAASSDLRLPAIELLLARGRRTTAAAQTLEAWLHDAFALEAPLAAGAFTLLGAGENPGEAAWVRADPVHLQLMRDRLIVVPRRGVRAFGRGSRRSLRDPYAALRGLGRVSRDRRAALVRTTRGGARGGGDAGARARRP
jgi:hypothetical protein